MSTDAEFNQVALGDSGMSVSSVGFGTYHLREKLGSSDAIDSLGAAFDADITLFDSSDNYGTEELIGLAVAEGMLPRSEVVIATKTGLATSAQEHLQWVSEGKQVDTSPARIRQQVHKSLRLLGDAVEVIDLYQLHVHDPSVPAEEHAEVMNGLIKEGKIRSYGVSNYPAEALSELLLACDTNGWTRPDTSQPFINILAKPGEAVDMAADEGLTLLAHSPLHKGLLVDGMVDELGELVAEAVAEAAAADDGRNRIIKLQEGVACLSQLRDYARDHGHSLAQLGIAWVTNLQKTVAITSCTNQQYLNDARLGSSWKLDKEAIDLVESTQSRLADLDFNGPTLRIMKGLKIYYR